jgi:hypothetical protein
MAVRRLAYACALALALAACGDNQVTITSSGSRLRLSWREYDDGSRTLVRGELWDAERQEVCVPERWPDGETYCKPVTAGAEDDRAGLARLHVTESTGGGRVGVRATTSDDGLYVPLDFVDRHLHAPCVFVSSSTPTSQRCVPLEAGSIEYRDAGCTDPVLALGEGDVEPPAAIGSGTTCEPRVFAVGAETEDHGTHALDQDGTCVEAARGPGRWLELVPHELATLARVRTAAPGRRLEPIHITVDGVRVADFALFDTEIGEECAAATSTREPGVYRCVPRDVGYVVDAYDDPACTFPIQAGLVYVGDERPDCDLAPSPAYARDFLGGTHIRRLGGPRTAPTYHTQWSGTCELDTTSYRRYYHLGEPIPDTQWARATVVRD